MLTVAQVVAAHGLRGQVRVELYTDFPERFAQLDEVWVVLPDGRRERHAISGVAPHPTKALLIVRFEKLKRREDAQRLVGASLQIQEDRAVPLPPGTYFEHDVIGLTVRTTDGRDLGKITEIIRTGSNDVYVTAACLIPAIADVVTGIDLEAGTMTIEPIPGLLDEKT